MGWVYPGNTGIIGRKDTNAPVEETTLCFLTSGAIGGMNLQLCFASEEVGPLQGAHAAFTEYFSEAPLYLPVVKVARYRPSQRRLILSHFHSAQNWLDLFPEPASEKPKAKRRAERATTTQDVGASLQW